MDARYHPPDIPGWTFCTNSCDPTAEQAERSYRRTVAEILAKYGLKARRYDVRIEVFQPDPEIKWAVYRWTP